MQPGTEAQAAAVPQRSHGSSGWYHRRSAISGAVRKDVWLFRMLLAFACSGVVGCRHLPRKPDLHTDAVGQLGFRPVFPVGLEDMHVVGLLLNAEYVLDRLTLPGRLGVDYGQPRTMISWNMARQVSNTSMQESWSGTGRTGGL